MPPDCVFGVGDNRPGAQMENQARALPSVPKEKVVIPEMNGEKLDLRRGIGQENPVMDLLDFPGLVVLPKANPPGIIGRIGTEGFGVVVGVELKVGITGLVDNEGSNEV